MRELRVASTASPPKPYNIWQWNLYSYVEFARIKQKQLFELMLMYKRYATQDFLRYA